jgi:3-methyladenine DNA glycosylase/8-oxoguanine DNA glycosylase
LIDLPVRPLGPYSLALSAAGSSDATRVFRDGIFTCALRVGTDVEPARAWQLPDGTVHLQAASDEGIERLRFVLAVDDDHSEFLRRYRGDPLLGRAVSHLQGLRPLRVGSVAQSLLRALCGQLIEAKRAWQLEKRVVRAVSPALGLLHAPPTEAELSTLSPADLRRIGLHARRGATLVRICSSLDLEKLHRVPTAAAVARLERERGLGPWSAALVVSEGLGRRERGLVGDLNLFKLYRALHGRDACHEDTVELLAPYAEFGALAFSYLMKGWSRGLLPVASRAAA